LMSDGSLSPVLFMGSGYMPANAADKSATVSLFQGRSGGKEGVFRVSDSSRGESTS
jgi:hypothetical protein